MSLADHAPAVAAALLLCVLIASVRQLRAPRRRPTLLTAILVLQLLAAALLYAVLQPPLRQVPGTDRVILLADASAAGALPASQAPPLLLPEAGDVAGGVRVPDLATALRQHPGAHLTLVGAGLPARDRDTPLPAQVHWQPAPTATGWVALQPPAVTAPGARFQVLARAHGSAGGQAELLDPAAVAVDRSTVAADGRVVLSAVARGEGRSVFQLRLLGADGHVIDTVPVPQQTVAIDPLRLRVRAGAPGAELKYLRRWAADGGLQVQMQMDTGAGMSVGDGSVALDAASLARTDLLVLDERSLARLGAGALATVRAAVREGLGVLVRLSGAPSATARHHLRELGLTLQGDGSSQTVLMPGDGEAAMLHARRGPAATSVLSTGDGLEADRASHVAPLPALERLDLQPAGAAALLQDRNGQALGGWRALGKGRVGVLPLTDSWRWVLAGRDDRHGELWSQVVAALARPRDTDDPLWSPQPLAWAGERTALCGAPATLQAAQRDGTTTALPVDPASGAARCAGWWPREAGWHRLQHGERAVWRYVFDPAAAAPLHRQGMIDATWRRLGAQAGTGTLPTQQVPGSRWPWWWAFLACAGLLWWLERRPLRP